LKQEAHLSLTTRAMITRMSHDFWKNGEVKQLDK